MHKHTLTCESKETSNGGVFKRACLHLAACASLLAAPSYNFVCLAQSPPARSAEARAAVEPRLRQTKKSSALVVSPTPKSERQSQPQERPSEFFEQLGAPFAGKKMARANAPMLGLAASTNVVTLCPGAEASARVRLTASGFDPERRRLRYRWRAAGGRIEGGGDAVTWDLSGVAPGNYSAGVSLEIAGDVPLAVAEKETHVVVRGWRPAPRAASCPTISLCCRAAVTAGEQALFEATLEGGAPGVTPTFAWSVSAGKVVSGSGTRAIGVDTAGLDGQTVLATFEPRGYGARCSSTCVTSILRAPVVPPTPTPPAPPPAPTPQHKLVTTPTPTPSPEPSPTATPLRVPALIPFNTSPPTQTLPPPPNALRPLLLMLLLAALAAASYMGLKTKGNVLTAGAGEGAAGGEATGAGGGAGEAAPVYTPPPVVVPVGDATAAAAADVGDEVHCTVFAPSQCTPGDGFIVQAFAHLAGQAPLLLEIANDSDEDTVQRGSEELSRKIARGQELVFNLHMPSLEVDQPTQSLIWDGKPESVQFGVTIPEARRVGSIIGTVTIVHQSIPIGHVKFKFKVAAAQTTVPQTAAQVCEKAEVPSQGFVRYKRAFISYASEDRAEVLKRVQMLNTVNIQFFQDLLSLEPGERWEKMLYKHIDESDVVFLFWSSAAKRSQWVERELQYALRRKGGNDVAPPEIMPIILEGPPIITPPDYLAQFHFNDKLLYFIKAEEDARETDKQA